MKETFILNENEVIFSYYVNSVFEKAQWDIYLSIPISVLENGIDAVRDALGIGISWEKRGMGANSPN